MHGLFAIREIGIELLGNSGSNIVPKVWTKECCIDVCQNVHTSSPVHY
jgi:hypothetical protein